MPVFEVAFWITPFLLLASGIVYFGAFFFLGVVISLNHDEIDLNIEGKSLNLRCFVSVITVAPNFVLVTEGADFFS